MKGIDLKEFELGVENIELERILSKRRKLEKTGLGRIEWERIEWGKV